MSAQTSTIQGPDSPVLSLECERRYLRGRENVYYFSFPLIFHCTCPEEHHFSMSDCWPSGHLGIIPSVRLEPSCPSLWEPTGKYSGILSAGCKPVVNYNHHNGGIYTAADREPSCLVYKHTPGPMCFWAALQTLSHLTALCWCCIKRCKTSDENYVSAHLDCP